MSLYELERLKRNLEASVAARVQDKRKATRAKAVLFRERLADGRFDLGLLCDLLDDLADGVTP